MDIAVLLDRIADGIATALGDELLGLCVHGSYVAGDFDPDRSDLDLLAVLATVPTTQTLERLRVLHDQLDAEHPVWQGRIEVDYLPLTTLTRLATEPGPMIRISPGEPLHLFDATRHYLINVASARQRGQALRGPTPAELVPPVDPADVRAVVSEHAANWPDWVRESRRTGSQAYAVLTLCRALHLVRTGEQLSKRQAGAAVAPLLPDRTDLITWAARWWYEGGNDDAPSRYDEVERFVLEVSTRIATEPQSGSRSQI